jgi:hypothetical protein
MFKRILRDDRRENDLAARNISGVIPRSGFFRAPFTFFKTKRQTSGNKADSPKAQHNASNGAGKNGCSTQNSALFRLGSQFPSPATGS